MPSPTTTRSGKEIKNRKVISKRRANQGLIKNKKRAATLGQAPKNKLRAKKMAAGLPVKSKLSGAKQTRIASGVTKAAGSKKKAPGTATSTRGKTVTNKTRAAKINYKQGNIKNRKFAQKQKAKTGGIANRKRTRKILGKKTKTKA